MNQQLEKERQALELTSVKLQEAMAIAKHSDQEKQKFIKQVQNELQYPLLTVIQASEFLLKETKKNNVIAR
ncbi:MAG: hypothetical protein LEGION0398_MBIBDBAK_01281 [Legionellaceae bacterium]